VFGAGAKAARVVPNKVVQQMAAGRPVLTAGTPAVRAALGDAVATVPPSDPDALAAAIDRLVGSPEAARGRRGALRRCAARGGPPRPPRRAPRRAGSAALMLPPLSPMAWLRYDAIRAVLDAARPRSVLEVGAGRGAMGARLARRFPYVGVEPDAHSFAAAQRAVGAEGGTVLHGEVAAVDPAARFDVVCAFEVLEHLPDDVGALADWAARLRPGGRVLLSVPADPARYGPADAAVGHVRRYTPESLTAALGAAGLEVRTFVTYGAGLGHLLEWARNRVLRTTPGADPAAGSARSGRVLQPRGPLAGAATAALAAPFRALQRVGPWSRRGVGYVVSAVRVDDARAAPDEARRSRGTVAR
jgi:SAM-dependent methyltransferase